VLQRAVRVLQCGAVWCSVLHVLQCFEVYRSVFQVCRSVLEYVLVFCSVLQRVAARCSVLQVRVQDVNGMS